MTRGRRWAVVAALLALVIVVPLWPRLLPVSDDGSTAASLLAAVQSSADEGWSGYVETDGSVALPVTGELGDVAALFGGRTRLRAWWRGPSEWRVARLTVSGEQDLRRDPRGLDDYDFESGRAELTAEPQVRLPRPADLLAPSLARTLLEGAPADRVERLPARRVAGRSVPGLRFTPEPGRSTIGRVDAWVEPETGLALRVAVTAAGEDDATFVSEVLDLDLGRPDDDQLNAGRAPGVELVFGSPVDIADAAQQYAPYVVPDELDGLPRTSQGSGAAGVYGSGVERVLVVPLRDSDADGLRERLLLAPEARPAGEGITARSGPFGVRLTDGGQDWLLVGTLTGPTLRRIGDVLDRLRPVADR